MLDITGKFYANMGLSTTCGDGLFTDLPNILNIIYKYQITLRFQQGIFSTKNSKNTAIMSYNTFMSYQ